MPLCLLRFCTDERCQHKRQSCETYYQVFHIEGCLVNCRRRVMRICGFGNRDNDEPYMEFVLLLCRSSANRPMPTVKNETKYRSRPNVAELELPTFNPNPDVQNKRKKIGRPNFRRKYSALIVEITHLCDLGYFGFVV